MDWTDDQVRMLRDLWDKGETASDIACIMSSAARHWITRNAIIGKAYRLGLPDRSPPKPRSAEEINRARREKRRDKAGASRDKSFLERCRHANPLKKALSIVPTQSSGHSVSILALSSRKCRWPLWGVADKGGLYCGDTIIEGRPYCAHHCGMAYQPRR
jgi:GcrA cell cycle regulator